jgi:hypothetical protein
MKPRKIMGHEAIASETAVQSAVRLRAAQLGMRLWRNNVGVLKDSRGVPVRFGLANDSKALNSVLKSADLVGWETITITPDMVGQRIARVLSVECKPAGWVYTGDSHEEAQKRWRDLINEAGGRAMFAAGPDCL